MSDESPSYFDRVPSLDAMYVKFVVLFAFLVVLPGIIRIPVLEPYLGTVLSLKILILTLTFAYASQAWNIMSGYAGQFSFGHAAFFGIGAYATQKLLIDFGINPWIGMIVGAVIATVYGSIIGVISVRYDIRGHYFALITLAFAELLQLAVKNVKELNAALGYYRPFARTYASGPGIVAFQFNSDLPYYYVMLGFLVLITVVSLWLKRSQYGVYLFAIRDNEDAAASVGIPVARFKLFSIVLSTFFTAWAGAYWSMYFTTIQPSTVFGIFRNVDIFLPTIIGGIGTVFGPILGAFLVIPVSELARTTFDEIHGLHQAIYAIVLIAIGIYNPDGAIELPKNVWHRFRSSDDRRVSSGAVGTLGRGDDDE